MVLLSVFFSLVAAPFRLRKLLRAFSDSASCLRAERGSHLLRPSVEACTYCIFGARNRPRTCFVQASLDKKEKKEKKDKKEKAAPVDDEAEEQTTKKKKSKVSEDAQLSHAIQLTGFRSE